MEVRGVIHQADDEAAQTPRAFHWAGALGRGWTIAGGLLQLRCEFALAVFTNKNAWHLKGRSPMPRLETPLTIL